MLGALCVSAGAVAFVSFQKHSFFAFLSHFGSDCTKLTNKEKEMKKTNLSVVTRWGLRFGGLALLFLLLALPASQARAGDDAVSIGAYLNADGTLNLPAGQAISSLDPAGYKLISKAEEAPRFAPTFAPDFVQDRANWDPRFPLSGLNGAVNALAWDGTNLYVGGDFTTAGAAAANRIARWDGATWSALGSGMNGPVHALAWDGTNSILYAGGDFTTAGVGANYIARWNGATWSTLIGSGDVCAPGGGTNGPVYALAWDGTNLYVGGNFTEASCGVAVNHIALWDGATFSALGSGMSNTVQALAWNGTSLYAGGIFATAGGVTVNYIARWDGETWSALGGGMNNAVWSLAWDGTNLYAGGSFTTAGGVAANRIARWDGGDWSALGSGMNGSVRALAWDGMNLYAGGFFTTAGGGTVNRIASWDGATWSALGSGIGNTVNALAWDGTTLYAGGNFTTAGVGANYITRWDGATWSALGDLGDLAGGMNNTVYALAWDGANLYVGGDFTTAGGVAANRIARWDGATWSALGSGMNNTVYALAWDGTNLYAGGAFNTAGGGTVNRIASWDGATWSALSGGTNNTVRALAWSGTTLYVGGSFSAVGGMGGVTAKGVARWNGTTWGALGSGTSGAVHALAWDGANLYAGGDFTTAGAVTANYIARWGDNKGKDEWFALGSGMDGPVHALAWDGVGASLYAGGDFTTAGGGAANRIARWNSGTWNALGSGIGNTVNALAWDGTNLYAGGAFTTAAGKAANYIARWHSGAWSPLATSAVGSGMNGPVNALAWDGDSLYDSLYAGGAFSQAGGKPSSRLARWRYAAVWDGGGVDNNGSTAANWSGNSVPLGADVVIFDATSSKDAILDGAFLAGLRGLALEAGYGGVVSQNRSLALAEDLEVHGGTLAVADPTSLPFTVEGSVVHSGGILQQTRNVGSNSAVNFLQIQTSGGSDVYRGVDLDTNSSGSNLGDVTVSIRAVDRVTEFCTTEAGSPAYANRCFTISPLPGNSAPARVTLWALTSEVPALVATPTIYRYVTGVWQPLTMINTGATGNYRWVAGDTPGFSSFLIADADDEPTAVTLSNIAAQSSSGVNWLVVLTLALGLTVSAGYLARKRQTGG
jgi:hypothetical protein